MSMKKFFITSGPGCFCLYDIIHADELRDYFSICFRYIDHDSLVT